MTQTISPQRPTTFHISPHHPFRSLLFLRDHSKIAFSRMSTNIVCTTLVVQRHVSITADITATPQGFKDCDTYAVCL
jgi:hypothetical protein